MITTEEPATMRKHLKNRNLIRRQRKYILEFLGVNASSDVTVNGKELAHHDGGYSTFRINI